jgi:hypothetical protein
MYQNHDGKPPPAVPILHRIVAALEPSLQGTNPEPYDSTVAYIEAHYLVD